jgi:hypothetical protein
VGAVLMQCRILPDGVIKHEPLAFASKKFSNVATRWSTYEQETYAIFYAVYHFDYFFAHNNFDKGVLF